MAEWIIVETTPFNNWIWYHFLFKPPPPPYPKFNGAKFFTIFFLNNASIYHIKIKINACMLVINSHQNFDAKDLVHMLWLIPILVSKVGNKQFFMTRTNHNNTKKNKKFIYITFFLSSLVIIYLHQINKCTNDPI